MKKNKKPTAEEIAEMADRGEDVTQYMGVPKKGGVHRTTLDLGHDLMEDLGYIARSLNISRQAVIKMAMQDYVIKWKNAKQLKLDAPA